ncbi:MAG TPA: hypothetical protein VD998_01065 [Verrucomicrobiae bacterium]|nr:hypothetical protein [Verrucomicrobiae bacterium]
MENRESLENLPQVPGIERPEGEDQLFEQVVPRESSQAETPSVDSRPIEPFKLPEKPAAAEEISANRNELTEEERKNLMNEMLKGGTDPSDAEDLAMMGK